MDTTQPVGLCLACRHHAHVPSARGSVFHRCRLSEQDDRFPRYPRLPVLECAGYEPATERGRDAPDSPSSPPDRE